MNVYRMERGLAVFQRVKVEIDRCVGEIEKFVRCLEISCPALKPNSRVIHQCSLASTIEKNHFEVGAECEAKCNQTGYRIVGPRIRKCLPIGKWTGYDQSCIGK